MKPSERLYLACTALAAGLMALTASLVWSWAWALIFTALGLFQFFAYRRAWEWGASVALISWVGSAALGLQGGLPALLMLTVVVISLAAWDLGHLGHQLRRVKETSRTLALERQHILLVAGVLSAGLVIAGMAFFLELSVDFGVILLLALLLALSLTRLISSFKNPGSS